MVHWAGDISALPSNAAVPCVLMLPISGSELEQRASRRAFALEIARHSFGETGLKIGTNAQGALRFFKNDAPAPLFLSHATRGSHSAVAVARQPIGIDLELFQPAFEPAWNILHVQEKHLLEALDPAERHAVFLKIWTAKEACLKMLGQGLLLEPSTLEIKGDTAHYHDDAADFVTRFKLSFFSNETLICALALAAAS